jgi:hypothetical protein
MRPYLSRRPGSSGWRCAKSLWSRLSKYGCQVLPDMAERYVKRPLLHWLLYDILHNNDSKYLPQLIMSFLPAGMPATPLCVARYLVQIEVLPSGVGNCFVIREYKGYIWKEPCEEYNNGWGNCSAPAALNDFVVFPWDEHEVGRNFGCFPKF